jgi:hypothetical protein
MLLNTILKVSSHVLGCGWETDDMQFLDGFICFILMSRSMVIK